MRAAVTKFGPRATPGEEVHKFIIKMHTLNLLINFIGRNPSTPDSSDWLGWSNPDVSNSEILFLFTARRVIQNISIFYHTQDGTLNGVEFYEEDGLVSGLSETTESDGFVYRGIYSHSRLLAGYLRVKLIGTNPVIITEIEVIQSDESNMLGPVLDTSRFTIPSSIRSTQSTSTNTLTTQTSEFISATNHRTSPKTNIATQITTQSIFKPTTQIIDTANITATQYTTMPPTCLSSGHISLPVIIGISLTLFLSICLNIALVLLLLVCYSRHYRTAVRMRKEERDQGYYVPMAPVETKNYENVPSKSGMEESATQQQKGDTKDQHYYSKIENEYVAST